MRKFKEIAMRMIPVMLVIAVTLTLTSIAYHQMLKAEEKVCWSFLEESAQNVARDIQRSFDGNTDMLKLAANAIAMKEDVTSPKIYDYLAMVQEMTVFSRIDILYPDNTVYTSQGEQITLAAQDAFAYLARSDTFMTQRMTDALTGRESIYCVMPIRQENRIAAILIGRTDCQTLHEKYPVNIYGGQTKQFLVDRADGSFIMDNWQEQMGSLFDMGGRKLMPGYESVDFLTEIANGQTGTAAFYSNVNGQASYMYYLPVPGYNWAMALMVQEDQIFARVRSMQNNLNMIGVIEGALLLVYLGWNILITFSAVSSRERAQQLEMERAANEAKSHFLANMSHDIRTPLNGIIGMLDVFRRRGEVPEQMNEGLHKIEVAAKYLLTLANDMLELNEIESGRVMLSCDPIDIRTLGSDLDVIMSPKAKQAGVEYNTLYGPIEHPYVQGSAVHVNRILANLASNAIKYNREHGEVWVSIEEVGATEKHATYRFSVRDTGIGISERFQQRMFDSFEQEGNKARNSGLGYGLGLSIVKRLVEAMGGQIEVKSRVDEGSTFTVLLTFQLDPVQYRIHQQAKQKAEEPTDLREARILLVEDNELNLEIAEALLTDAGAQVTVAHNGREAVDLFGQAAPGAFNVILMDIMMPEMNGYEATQAIRAMDRPDATLIPIIARTAITFAEDVRRCEEVGMNAHIAKPLDMKVVMAKIAHYLRDLGKNPCPIDRHSDAC